MPCDPTTMSGSPSSPRSIFPYIDCPKNLSPGCIAFPKILWNNRGMTTETVCDYPGETNQGFHGKYQNNKNLQWVVSFLGRFFNFIQMPVLVWCFGKHVHLHYPPYGGAPWKKDVGGHLMCPQCDSTQQPNNPLLFRVNALVFHIHQADKKEQTVTRGWLLCCPTLPVSQQKGCTWHTPKTAAHCQLPCASCTCLKGDNSPYDKRVFIHHSERETGRLSLW